MRGGMLVLLLGALLLAVPAANAADGYTVANGATTTINEHGYCRKVTNNIVSGLGIFVPTKYNYEWFNNAVSFVSSTPAGVSLASCIDAVSLRFNSADTIYLDRTPSTGGDRRTWTFSFWVKRSSLGSNQHLFDSLSSASNVTFLRFAADDSLLLHQENTTVRNNYTAAVFRDMSAWYHIVLMMDTTQATDSDRLKLWVNGVLQAFASPNWPSLNENTLMNHTVEHRIGRGIETGSLRFDGYMANIHFVDGLNLSATDFGQFDPTTLQWVPKTYSGAYGTNGFHINFQNAASLGADSSGNGNNWTVNGVTTSAGPNYDPMRDYMTSFTSEGWGNTATLNPLHNAGTTLGTASDGNLYWSANGGSGEGYIAGTMAVKSGKWYFEYTRDTGTTHTVVGVTDIGVSQRNTDGTNPFDAGIGGAWYSNNASGASNGYNANGVGGTSSGISIGTGDVLAFAFDASNGNFWLGQASGGSVTWGNSGDPATDANPTGTITTVPNAYIPYVANFSSSSGRNTRAIMNFGQQPFVGAVPAGFAALQTHNLPVPAIVTPTAYFKTLTYTGTGSAQSITGLDFQPDLVWIKSRSAATDHALYDSARGVQQDLATNNTSSESTQAQGLTAFNSNGFTIGSLGKLNTNSADYVAWAWKKGTTPGFNVVTYTGNNGNGQPVAHGLGKAPAMFILKARNSGQNWKVWHSALTPESNECTLSSNSGCGTSTAIWNNTAPDSTNIYVGKNGWAGQAQVNGSGVNYIVYAWAEVPGFSNFGIYTGNGSNDGPFINTGFRPAFVLIKQSSASGNSWQLVDMNRPTYNPIDTRLVPDGNNSENSLVSMDLLSNGFKIRTNNNAFNASGATYIYAAFAEAPFKYANAR